LEAPSYSGDKSSRKGISIETPTYWDGNVFEARKVVPPLVEDVEGRGKGSSSRELSSKRHVE
jgi:hypothetical protein